MILVHEVLLPLGDNSVSCAATLTVMNANAAKKMVLIVLLVMMSFVVFAKLLKISIFALYSLHFLPKSLNLQSKKKVFTMNKLFLLLVLVAVVIAIWAMNGRNVGSDAFRSVDNDEFEQLLADSNVVLLDVRTQSEFDEGHLKGAVLIDVKTDSFMMAARDRLPKDKIIAVYCRSGRRSVAAAERLAADGYQVVNLKGGISSWTAAGKETVK